MSHTEPILSTLFIFGFLFITIGLILKVHPYQFSFSDIKNSLRMERLARMKILSPFLTFLSGHTYSKRFRFLQKMLSKSETEMSVQALYLLKLTSVICVAVIGLLISFTNADAVKISIMSKPQDGFQIFQDISIQDYSRNAALYRTVVGRIGEDNLKKLDQTGKLQEIERVLPALMGTGEREIIEEKAANILKSFDAIANLNPFNFQIIILIAAAFWLPELVLLIKRLLLGNKYRKEVIKLENIFELLGSIRNFKTIDILEEMAKASKTYRKHLEFCKELFKTEKEQALELLKVSVKNSRFSRLVDILRVYSMTDKKLAMQIMERNRLEKEEEVLLTAEEDIDLVDLIAFISIIPILLQLANLLLKPMLDMIYEAFQFI